jgi:hypothetical protein
MIQVRFELTSTPLWFQLACSSPAHLPDMIIYLLALQSNELASLRSHWPRLQLRRAITRAPDLLKLADFATMTASNVFISW